MEAEVGPRGLLSATNFIPDLSGNASWHNLMYTPFRISDGTVSNFNAGDCLKALSVPWFR